MNHGFTTLSSLCDIHSSVDSLSFISLICLPLSKIIDLHFKVKTIFTFSMTADLDRIGIMALDILNWLTPPTSMGQVGKIQQNVGKLMLKLR